MIKSTQDSWIEIVKSIGAGMVALNKEKDELEGALEELWGEHIIFYQYICNNKPQAFVEYVYRKEPKKAKKIVASFHDDVLDLSKLSCSSKDFEPWEEE